MTINIFSFNELDARTVYEVLDLRNRVFVEEQNCVYLDTDNKDFNAYHVLFRDDQNKLIAYSRLLPPGVSYEKEASIGRVVTSPDARGKGLGKLLMQESLARVRSLFPGYPVKIEAQSYLIPFYAGFGFQPLGEDYLLDGILHREMILPTIDL